MGALVSVWTLSELIFCYFYTDLTTADSSTDEGAIYSEEENSHQALGGWFDHWDGQLSLKTPQYCRVVL